ncbi:MAG: zinc ribbon domain-containing protein [Pseudonocardiaceae bacterium]
MTAGTNTGDSLRCYNCSHPSQPGDRFCEQCGSALLGIPTAGQPLTAGQPGPDHRHPQVDPGPVGTVPTGPVSDGTTRYLCAAAHLDEEFCDAAIAEFLVEPVRAIPPSPGVDSAAVLREAVAAQTRRRIRDGLLLALLVVLVFVNFIGVIFWAVLVGIAVGLLALGRNRRTIAAAALPGGVPGDWRMFMGATGPLASDAAHNRRTLVWVVIVLWLVLVAPFFLLLGVLTTVLQLSGDQSIASALVPSNIGLTLLLGGLMLVVLSVDEFTVAKLMTSSFRRGRFDPDARRAPTGWESLVRSLGHNSFSAGLRRVARSDEVSQPAGQADVIVYRDYNPFIGAGVKIKHHVIALPLEPSEDECDGDPVPISVNDLHRHVADSLAALRSPSSLGPGRRLEQLRHREQVLMPADRLLINQFAQMQPSVLPDLFHPPLAHLPLGAARALAENPLEWARYYSCFRVETWDRDLTTSCYLHIGTDQRMLYLEWTYCVLLPVSERYRSVDRIRESSLTPLGRSLVELIIFPVTVGRRLRSTFRRHEPLIQRPGEVVPDRYGAAQSLRELAADTDTQTYFQEADVERYVNVIDGALVRAVGRYLEEQRYSVVEFTRMAVGNNFNIFQGDVIGNAFGRNSKVGDVRANTARSGGAKGAK